MSEESIHVEEEFTASENGKKAWEEELKVSGDELLGKVQELLKEAAVRKIVIKDEHGKTLLTIPLYAGVAGLLLFGPWSALALIAAWVANVSILIEYESLEEKLDDLTAIKGIGPKKAEVLHEAGIKTYVALAKLDVEKLMEIAAVNEATAQEWIAAAKALS